MFGICLPLVSRDCIVSIKIKHQRGSNQSNSKVENASGHRRGQPDGLNGLDKGLMTQTRSDIDDEGTNLTPCDVSLYSDVQDYKHKK